MGAEASFTAYGTPLVPVTDFSYLGRVFLADNDDWPAVAHNLHKAWQKWERCMRVLIREGEDARPLEHIYLAVVQLVLFYGSET